MGVGAVATTAAGRRRWGWVLAGAVVSAGVMLGVGGYALVAGSATSPDRMPPVVEPSPRPALPPAAPLLADPLIPPVVAPAPLPTATAIQLRTSVAERGRVLRGRTGEEVVGEINPQPLVLPRPQGETQTYRIEVDGYDPLVVELHENDPAVVLVTLIESQHRRRRRDAPDPAPHGRPLLPLTPSVTPPSHPDGLRDPWTN